VAHEESITHPCKKLQLDHSTISLHLAIFEHAIGKKGFTKTGANSSFKPYTGCGSCRRAVLTGVTGCFCA
jgi:hypothetical protein